MAGLTPNFDRLTSEGVTFTRAYAQQAICGPSRNSFLSGRRPDKIRTWTFETSFRTAPGGKQMVSLPQAFKNAGYFSCGMGKTYHDDTIYSPPNYDIPFSWSASCRYFVAQRDACPPGVALCSTQGKPDAAYEDSQVVANAVAIMGGYAKCRAGGERAPKSCPSTCPGDCPPFFLAVGVRRPHVPWAVPADVAAKVKPAAQIELAKHQTAPLNSPSLAFFNCLNEGDNMLFMLPQGTPFFNASIPLIAAEQQRLRRGYYASVAWADKKLGELLEAIDALGLANETVVIVNGDHGWQLGEHGGWCKETNFELATRVPLIVRDPATAARAPATRGRATPSIVELVSLYKTMAEIAGPSVTVQADVDGASFAHLLVSDEQPPPGTAFSQYPRCIGAEGVGGMVLCAVAHPIPFNSSASQRFAYSLFRSRCIEQLRSGSSFLRSAPPLFYRLQTATSISWGSRRGQTTGASRSGIRGTRRSSGPRGARTRSPRSCTTTPATTAPTSTPSRT